MARRLGGRRRAKSKTIPGFRRRPSVSSTARLPQAPISEMMSVWITEARVLSQDGKVLAHGTSTIMVLGGGR
jgi:hypothetical protein